MVFTRIDLKLVDGCDQVFFKIKRGINLDELQITVLDLYDIWRVFCEKSTQIYSIREICATIRSD